MRVLLLNQYFPPDPAPTGILLAEVAERLRAEGHAVDFIDAAEPYRAGQAKSGRIKRELTALLGMLWKGCGAARPDVVFSASSPPLLLVVATLIALRHRARSVHWAMDLYPELAVALGEIREGPLAKFCAGMMRWCYRRARLVVALDEDMAAHLRQRYGVEPEICRPWISAPVMAQLCLALAGSAAPVEPKTWIYSGNLGRAHEWETLLAAQRIIEDRDGSVRLLFQGGGPAWPAAQARAREMGLQRCDWQPYVAEEALPSSLLRGAVVVATQRPEARGYLWPSKLSLLLALPRLVLWIGHSQGAVAGLLKGNSFAPGDAEGVARSVLAAGSSEAKDDAAPRREAALDWWMRKLAQA